MTSVFLRPDADSSDGSWLNEASSGTNLFASVDDTTSTGADADYIRSSSAQGDKVRLRLSDPGVSVTAPMVVRYRVKAEALPAALVGRIYQGASTLIAYWEELPTTSFATYTYTLTTAEFNSITDFNDLYVEFEYDSAAPHLTGNIDLWFEADTYYDSSLDPASDPAHLMLHMDGADGSTTFIDATGRHTITVGGSANTDNAQFKFGSTSAEFVGGAGNNLLVNASGTTDFAFGTGDFTIDCWARFSSTASAFNFLFDSRPAALGGAGVQIYRTSSDGFLRVRSGDSSVEITGTTNFTGSIWRHVAVTRASGTWRLFIDGVSEGGTASDSVNITDTTLMIGAEANNSSLRWDGWIDEFRVVKGTAVWTSNFTPPTAPYAVQTGPYNLLSCSRASTGYGQTVAGTLTSFASNELRITDKGLLVEDARTNLCLNSQDITLANYVNNNVGTNDINDTAAPDGTVSAEKVTVTGAGTSCSMRANSTVSLTSATAYTISIYVKPSSGSTWCELLLSDYSANTFGAWFNMTGSGSIGASDTQGDGTVTTKTIEALANGWYRCIVTGQFTTGRGTYPAFYAPVSGDSSVNGTAGHSMWVWGHQVEAGSFASSYIPTTTVSVTRAQDLVTGIGNVVPIVQFASSGASVVAKLGLVANQAPSIILGNGSGYAVWDSSISPGKVSYSRPGGIEATLGTPSTWSDGAKVGIANISALNNRAVVGNGGTVVTDTNGEDLDPFILGISDFGQSFLYFQRLSFWNVRLADATLQGLTSP